MKLKNYPAVNHLSLSSVVDQLRAEIQRVVDPDTENRPRGTMIDAEEFEAGFDLIKGRLPSHVGNTAGRTSMNATSKAVWREGWQREAAATQAASTKVATFIAWTDVAPRSDSPPHASPDRR